MVRLINFRDFGGQETRCGARVLPDRLYRCGHLANVSNEDFEKVLRLNFAVIADLRYAGERESEPSPWPLDYGERIVAHDGKRDDEAPHMAMLRDGPLTIKAVDRFYNDLYRALPFDPLYRPLFAKTIQRLADSHGRLLIHCSAGKDRTGILCALLLHMLDVPRDAIIADYLRSANAPGLLALKQMIRREEPSCGGYAISEDAIDALLGVQPRYIDATFTAIEDKAGSVEDYLAESGVSSNTAKQLRRRLLSV